MQAAFLPCLGVAKAGLSTVHALSEELASLPSNATSSPGYCGGINVALEVWPWEVFNFPRLRTFAGPLCSH